MQTKKKKGITPMEMKIIVVAGGWESKSYSSLQKKTKKSTKVGFTRKFNSRFSELVNKTQQRLPSTMATFYRGIAGCDPLITNLPFHCVNVGLATHQDTLSIKCVLRHGRDAV